MGMFSEIHASHTAARLRQILLDAQNSEDKHVHDFCGKHIYPWYCEEKGEAWESCEGDEVHHAFWKEIFEMVK